jgi:hypothetical protein
MEPVFGAAKRLRDLGRWVIAAWQNRANRANRATSANPYTEFANIAIYRLAPAITLLTHRILG